MRRILMATSVLLLTAGALPAAADPGHERPKITVFRFTQTPLKAGIDEVLKVVAHDPNSWISEIQVRWEDPSGDGGVLFAHTHCVQDPDFSHPGTVATLTLPVHFDHPGSYHVEARAISARRCEPGNDQKTSRTLEKDVTVFDPLKTRTDPDDSSGALDIASVEQTQRSSQTSATTEIVHRVEMFEPWTDEQLSGQAYMEIWFDLDEDASDFERVLTMDFDENDATLRAGMLDTRRGQGRGYAAVSRPDEKTIEVRFPPLLVKRGLRSYRWYVHVDGGEQDLCAPPGPCTDRAPDTSLMRHRL